jgi:arylsulfatase A-like enzyme
MRGASRRTALVLAALLATAAAREAPARAPDVVVIVVDTLRADRLGVYGSRRGLTPFLDAFARRAHVAERAYAQAPWTSPSVASLFTSRYPSQHGIVGFDSVLGAGETTLAEVLREAGYATGAFSANGLLSRNAGFDQGFNTYRAYLDLRGDPARRFLRPARRAGDITDEALRWLAVVERLRGPDAPVFLYLHYMEPHSPYAPPAELLARVRGDKPPLDLDRVNLSLLAANLAPPAPDVLADILDAYDAEVLAIDTALRRLWTKLERRGMGERALVVVTADHGEEFQEHGGMGHGRTLYGEVMHVPLIVRSPGQTRGGIIERVVSSIDVAPTVLDMVGVEPAATFEGVSFARDLATRGAGPSIRRLWARLWDDRPRALAYGEQFRQWAAKPDTISHQSAVVLGEKKVIAWTDGRRDFYALDDDPGEQRPNRVGAAERDELVDAHDAIRARVTRDRTPAATHTVDPRTRDALRALGYAD